MGSTEVEAGSSPPVDHEEFEESGWSIECAAHTAASVTS